MWILLLFCTFYTFELWIYALITKLLILASFKIMNKDIHDKLGIHIEGLQIILSVKDMNASKAFYKDILGFNEVDWGTDDFTSVNRENAGIYLCKGAQGNPGTWIWVGFDGDILKLHNDPTLRE